MPRHTHGWQSPGQRVRRIIPCIMRCMACWRTRLLLRSASARRIASPMRPTGHVKHLWCAGCRRVTAHLQPHGAALA